MKKSDLREIIKSEIKKELKEQNKTPREIPKKELMDDLYVTLLYRLPHKKEKYDELKSKYVKSVKLGEITDSWPLDATIIFKDGLKIKASKKSRWCGDWEFDIKGKKFGLPNDRYKLEDYFEDKYLQDNLKNLEYQLGRHDWTHEYSDDYRYVSSGQKHKKQIINIYKNLDTKDKKEALKLWKKYANKMFIDSPFWGVK